MKPLSSRRQAIMRYSRRPEDLSAVLSQGNDLRSFQLASTLYVLFSDFYEIRSLRSR